MELQLTWPKLNRMPRPIGKWIPTFKQESLRINDPRSVGTENLTVGNQIWLWVPPTNPWNYNSNAPKKSRRWEWILRPQKLRVRGEQVLDPWAVPSVDGQSRQSPIPSKNLRFLTPRLVAAKSQMDEPERARNQKAHHHPEHHHPEHHHPEHHLPAHDPPAHNLVLEASRQALVIPADPLHE